MKPLESVTILEFSTMITASLASMMMAEQGARVIKVEPMEMGDPMRYIGARKADISALFANCNRGKESLRIDLKSAEGVETIKAMIPAVDVVIHNFRPGVMDKLGLGSECLRSINPKLIYTAISGFGTKGPLSGAPAYDPMIQAHAGVAAAQGRGDQPAFMRTLLCDKITGYTACQAVTSALFMRERVGEGQHLDLSMIDSGLFFIFLDGFQNDTLLSDDHERGPMLIDILYDPWLCSDGSVIISLGSYEIQRRFLTAIDMSQLLEDPRFDSFENQIRNIRELKALVAPRCAALTCDDMVDRLRLADVPCAKVMTREEVLSQEQLAANGTVEIYDHPVAGLSRRVLSPPLFGGERLEAGRGAPTHGQHTDSVLQSFGLSDERVQHLRNKAVIT
jgi:crotonobetainyl-CoA:carnitine CoA-transferase CaiB-like acyl-CoA transferase